MWSEHTPLLLPCHSYQPGDGTKGEGAVLPLGSESNDKSRRFRAKCIDFTLDIAFILWCPLWSPEGAGGGVRVGGGGGTFCAPTDDQSCLIVFASMAAAGALILRHIPFRSPGQAFIARAYQVHKGSSLNNWTISYQGWHPYKDVPLTASAQTGEWIKPHSFVPKARPSSSASGP